MGWQQTAEADDVGASVFAAAFDPDPNYVWTADDPSLGGGDVQRRHYADLSPVSASVVDVFEPNPGGSYITYWLAVDAAGDVWTIGLDTVSTRYKLWRWHFDDPTWSGTLFWQSELDAISPFPSVTYNPADGMLYLKSAYDGGSVVEHEVWRIDPAGGQHPAQQGPEHLIWSDTTPVSHLFAHLIVTSDGRIAWPIANSDADITTIYSYDTATDTLDSFVHSTAGIQHLIHSPNSGARFIGSDQLGPSYWEYPSNVANESEVSYPPLTGPFFVVGRGAALSHDGRRAVFLAQEPFEPSGGWWYRTTFHRPRWWAGVAGQG